MNKRGFTLIELLAVIVILAIILVIAVPSVLGIQKDAKQKVAKDEALMLVKSIETCLAANQNVTNNDLNELCGPDGITKYYTKNTNSNFSYVLNKNNDDLYIDSFIYTSSNNYTIISTEKDIADIKDNINSKNSDVIFENNITNNENSEIIDAKLEAINVINIYEKCIENEETVSNCKNVDTLKKYGDITGNLISIIQGPAGRKQEINMKEFKYITNDGVNCIWHRKVSSDNPYGQDTKTIKNYIELISEIKATTGVGSWPNNTGILPSRKCQ